MTRLTPDEVILGLIKAQPSHGYELLETFRDRDHLGRIWNMSTSQLYAVLKRLEEEGTIAGREIPCKDAPSRTEYSLTDLGESRLNTWLYDPFPPISIHRIRVQFLSRLYIATLLNLPTDEIITHQLVVCRVQREVVEKEAKSTKSSVEALTLDFVLGQLNACIAWLDRCYDYSLEIPAKVSQPTQQNDD